MSNQEYTRSIAERFGISESSVIKYRNLIIGKLNSLMEKFFKWPHDSRRQHISRNFEEKRGLSGIVGAIDGCHISIRPPSKNP